LKYRVHLRLPNGKTHVHTIECDGVDFANAWWARFWRHGGPPTSFEEGTIVEVPRVIVAAVPGEHLTLIELVP